MDRKILKYLLDVKNAIDRIEFYIADTPSLKEYCENLMLQHAVERNLEIIGEAINRILKIQDINISNSKRIIGTRNVIIHGYDVIEPENIWDIIINHVPLLKSEVAALLNE